MNIKTPKKITRNLAGLREAGFRTLEEFMDRKIGTEHVEAVNTTIRTICLTIAMERKDDEANKAVPSNAMLPRLPR